MAYLTVDELKREKWERILIQLVSSDGATLDAQGISAIGSAIADADSLIDSKLASKYTVPLSGPVPPIISRLSRDITLYFLYGRETNDPPADVRLRYEDALKSLDKLADGSNTIPDYAPITEGQPPVLEVKLYATPKMTMNAFGDTGALNTGGSS